MFCDKCGAGLQADQRFVAAAEKKSRDGRWDIRNAAGSRSMFGFSEFFAWRCRRSMAYWESPYIS
jgi:hypothetical protein